MESFGAKIQIRGMPVIKEMTQSLFFVALILISVLWLDGVLVECHTGNLPDM